MRPTLSLSCPSTMEPVLCRNSTPSAQRSCCRRRPGVGADCSRGMALLHRQPSPCRQCSLCFVLHPVHVPVRELLWRRGRASQGTVATSMPAGSGPTMHVAAFGAAASSAPSTARRSPKGPCTMCTGSRWSFYSSSRVASCSTAHTSDMQGSAARPRRDVPVVSRKSQPWDVDRDSHIAGDSTKP